MTRAAFRTIRVGPGGWLLLVVGGAALGLGLARLMHWPTAPAAVVGIVLLIVVLRLLDGRAFKRATTVIRLDRSVAQLDGLAGRLRGQGLGVAVSRDPMGIACKGRIHQKVVTAIEADAAERRRP